MKGIVKKKCNSDIKRSVIVVNDEISEIYYKSIHNIW